MPHNKKYSILIINSKDTLYSYDSVFWREFNKDATGIYEEFEGGFIRFECYLLKGKLNGLYKRYKYESELLWMYGKYVNDVSIEKNEITYDDRGNVMKVDTDKTPKPMVRNK